MKPQSRNPSLELYRTLVMRTITAGSVGLKLYDLQHLMPEIPRSQVQSVMRKLKKEGEIRVEGKTSSARWYTTGA